MGGGRGRRGEDGGRREEGEGRRMDGRREDDEQEQTLVISAAKSEGTASLKTLLCIVVIHLINIYEILYIIQYLYILLVVIL